MLAKVIIISMTMICTSTGSQIASSEILNNLLDKAGTECDIIFLPRDDGDPLDFPESDNIIEQVITRI